MEKIRFFRCSVCGNIVALIHRGGGTLVCCGQNMTELEANTSDGAKEKHVPAISMEEGKIVVAVGTTLHPMIPEHFIQWIALEADGRLEFAYLKPGMEPKAKFAGAETGTVYEYCNLHGLWKAEF